MRALTLVFAIGLAVATTADGALAQNTLLLGRGQPPRQTTGPLTTYPNYGNRPSGQFFAPAKPAGLPDAERSLYGHHAEPACPAPDFPSTVWPVIDEGGRTDLQLSRRAACLRGDAVCHE